MKVPESDPEFEALLNYLKYNRGCDLTGYKRSTLVRRFAYRMRSLCISSYQDYWQYLQAHPEEYLTLLNDVLINVTSFFRDSEAWDYLASDIVPKVIEDKEPNETIRLWSAGCATGQEAFSLIILLAEALGIEACSKRVRCYATDADEVAIQKARKATFSDFEIQSIPVNLLNKYFEKTDRGYVFHPKLRHSIIFGCHNLAQDSPLAQIDLLVCRNVFMYFNLETQNTILTRFHFALINKGFLFVGKAETLINRRQIFSPINSLHRVYVKGEDLELEEHLLMKPIYHRIKPAADQPINQPKKQNYFWQTAFEVNPIALLAVDINDCLVSANKQSNSLFNLTLNDWGKPFRELEPGKLVDPLFSVETFEHNHDPVVLRDIEWSTSSSKIHFNITITPVLDHRRKLLGTIFSFVDTNNSLRDKYKNLVISDGCTRVTGCDLISTLNLVNKIKRDRRKFLGIPQSPFVKTFFNSS
jgi:two-component system CheB/CheR fusion protein